MMSYHNLHLLRYRRAPESNISKENNESGSDHNHMTTANNNNNINNYSNPNRQHMLPTSSSTTTTTILTNIQNRTQHAKHIRTKDDDTKQSRIWFITHCCRTNNLHRQEHIHKRSSSTTSSKATASNNILVDYCTYHDVAVSRVTCV